MNGVQVNFWKLWGFIRGIEASQIFERACLRLSIQSFGVTTDAVFDWRINENFNEFSDLHKGPYPVAFGSVGRDERAQNYEAALSHQLCNFADPPDVLHPIGLGKAQITIESVANVVAVQQHCVMTGGVQTLLHNIGDGRFARARQPREPDDGRLLIL